MLAPDKEHKKGFTEVPIVGLRNGKSLKDEQGWTMLEALNHVRRILVKYVII